MTDDRPLQIAAMAGTVAADRVSNGLSAARGAWSKAHGPVVPLALKEYRISSGGSETKKFTNCLIASALASACCAGVFERTNTVIGLGHSS